MSFLIAFSHFDIATKKYFEDDETSFKIVATARYLKSSDLYDVRLMFFRRKFDYHKAFELWRSFFKFQLEKLNILRAKNRNEIVKKKSFILKRMTRALRHGKKCVDH